MRTYIYTDHERRLLTVYLTGNLTRRDPQLNTLLTRTTRHTPTLLPDIHLLTTTLRTINTPTTYITINPIPTPYTPGLHQLLQQANNPHHPTPLRIKYATLALTHAQKNL